VCGTPLRARSERDHLSPTPRNRHRAESRIDTLIFIGRNLVRETLNTGFKAAGVS